MDQRKTWFSTATRAAAIATRKKNIAEREAAKGQPAVFAVRRGTGFTWELRQFGAIVMASGNERFSTSAAAIVAGNLALALRNVER